MKDPIEWQNNLAICNDTANEIMDKFWDRLFTGSVHFPEGEEIFTTSTDISEANKDV
jgi:hypothetical protein